jgi:hypothetical protein
MTSQLNHLIAQEHNADLLAQAERHRAGRTGDERAPGLFARVAMRARSRGLGRRRRYRTAASPASREPSLATVSHQTSDNCY